MIVVRVLLLLLVLDEGGKTGVVTVGERTLACQIQKLNAYIKASSTLAVTSFPKNCRSNNDDEGVEVGTDAEEEEEEEEVPEDDEEGSTVGGGWIVIGKRLRTSVAIWTISAWNNKRDSRYPWMAANTPQGPPDF